MTMWRSRSRTRGWASSTTPRSPTTARAAAGAEGPGRRARLYVQTLVQYNDAADVWSTSLRLGWLQAAGTGLFVVLSQTDDFGRAEDLGRALDAEAGSQTLIVKYSRLINLLN